MGMMKQKGYSPIKSGFAPIIILILIATGIAGYFGYKYFKTTQAVSPTPILTPAPRSNLLDPLNTTQTINGIEFTFNYCGRDEPKVGFQITLPDNWILSSKSDASWASYDFKYASSFFEVACGTGFGGDCETQYQTNYIVDGKSQKGCYKNGIGGIFLKKEDVTFVLSGEADRQIISQILSTFKFTQ